MTLNEAMVKVLKGNGGQMFQDDLAAEIHNRGLYTKKDDSRLSGGQVRLRARKYNHLFYEENGHIYLKT